MSTKGAILWRAYEPGSNGDVASTSIVLFFKKTKKQKKKKKKVAISDLDDFVICVLCVIHRAR
jgi:hypothetical protein